MNAEEKQALIEYCKEEVRLKTEHIARLEKHMPGQFDLTRYQMELQTAQIALAALTAQPDDWQQRVEAAEEKLAELENQEPIGRVDRGEANDNNEYPGVRVVCLHEQADWINFQDGTELFLRPAPAVSLAELVPGEYTSADIPCAMTDTIQAEMDGWNACRSEMLLKIEGAK